MNNMMNMMNNMMSIMRHRMAVPIMGGAGLFGAVLYFRSRPSKSREQQAHERRALKQEQGVVGAGVGAGNTGALGGHELGQPGSGHDSPSFDRSRRVETTAPIEKLPSGGIAGGGEASPRDINFPGLDRGQVGRDEGGVMSGLSRSKPYEREMEPGSSSSSKDAKNNSSKPEEKNSASQTLQGLFGQGGKTSQDRNEMDRFHDTKIASHQPDTPTKKTSQRAPNNS